MMFTKHKYPKDWWKSLKEGDTVKCVKESSANKELRPVGSILGIHSDNKFPSSIPYLSINGTKAWSSDHSHFIPIKMSAFTDNQIKDCYDVY